MLTLNKVSALSEDESRETIERILWPNGPVCPHCGATENVTRLQGKAHRAGGHHRVDHDAGEYARGEAHVNTAESFFALLKRGIVGSFHHISPEHLHRYCDEFSSVGIIAR